MKRIHVVVVVMLGSLALISAGLAQTAWNGGASPDNSWFNGSNWTAGVPLAATPITINGATYHAVIDSGNAVSAGFALTNGSLTVSPGRIWTPDITSGTQNMGSGFTLNVNGGTVQSTADNGWVNVSGTINVTGGGLYRAADYGYLKAGSTVNLGDAISPGHYRTKQSRNENNVTIRGWGTFTFGGWSDSWFDATRVVADGWGGNADRELLFATHSLNNYEWRGGGENTSAPYDKGWFAVNRGKLTLPGVRFTSAILTQNWGERNAYSFDPSPDMVNAINFTFGSIGHAGTKHITGSLLATDHSQVRGYSLPVDGGVSSVYLLTPDAGFAFGGSTTLTFRYDDVALGAAAEPYLSLWHFDPTLNLWKDIANLPGYSVVVNDAVGVKQLQVSGFSGMDSISGMFLLGYIVSPEPGTLVMAALALLLVGKRRARK